MHRYIVIGTRGYENKEKNKSAKIYVCEKKSSYYDLTLAFILFFFIDDIFNRGKVIKSDKN